MNDAPIKQPDASTTDTSAELQEPHFDEIAVLIAQPVEPIARRERDWFAWLEKPRTVLAIVFISSMMGIIALALTLQLHTQPHVDTAATEIQTEQTTSAPESQAPESQAPESQVVADTEQQSASPRRSKMSKTRPSVEDDDSKPKARRVGVIHYGSSSDRP
jgi:hypothetical protein